MKKLIILGRRYSSILEMNMSVHPQRIKQLKAGSEKSGPVVYWMSRDQRVMDNWALIHAQNVAIAYSRPLRIAFCLTESFLGAGRRHYDFMLKGLKECFSLAGSLCIPLDLIKGNAEIKLPAYLKKHKASFLFMDFDPLRIKKKWQSEVLKQTDISAYVIDAHNIVPCWEASGKQEYSARTIRPKIQTRLDEFMDDFPQLKKHPYCGASASEFEPETIIKNLRVDNSIPPVDWLKPGSTAGLEVLDRFLAESLSAYDQLRNDPNAGVLSNLSPYLHFGQLSSQSVALRVLKEQNTPSKSRQSFLEELIVRKELSDNFCHYNPDYDNFNGLPAWGQNTLDKHINDPRDYLYSLEEMEHAGTHDPLWNAAQLEMSTSGKMHGYMRMYWAKKILKWSPSPAQAIEDAVYLNDRYELDGRDPNGYTGILWSIGGLHDRPWKERPIFGTVRYMSYNGCRRKFNVNEYIRKWNGSLDKERKS